MIEKDARLKLLSPPLSQMGKKIQCFTSSQILLHSETGRISLCIANSNLPFLGYFEEQVWIIDLVQNVHSSEETQLHLTTLLPNIAGVSEDKCLMICPLFISSETVA